MGKNTLTYAMIYLLVGLVLGTIVFSVFVGKNSLISQEKEKYDETHVEEIQEKENKKEL